MYILESLDLIFSGEKINQRRDLKATGGFFLFLEKEVVFKLRKSEFVDGYLNNDTKFIYFIFMI